MTCLDAIIVILARPTMPCIHLVIVHNNELQSVSLYLLGFTSHLKIEVVHCFYIINRMHQTHCTMIPIVTCYSFEMKLIHTYHIRWCCSCYSNMTMVTTVGR